MASSDGGKSSPPASKSAGKTPKTQLTRIERELVALLQEHAQWLTELAENSKETADRRLADLAQGKLPKLPKNASGPLTPSTLTAIFRELASSERSLYQQQRAAYLGPEHSYSHLATLERFGSGADLVPVGSIAAVFEEVVQHHVQWGVVPIENSSDGRIVDTLEMFTRSEVQICGEVPLPIHHNLLGMGSRSSIEEVCSKPQALSQCRNWLATHLPKARLVPMSSTTAAAERAAEDTSVAAVASRQAGARYGLKVLAKNIEDKKNNVTRFAVIGHERAPRTGNDKTSIMFELKHAPGALADAMMIFKRKDLNLTWIESFPKPNSPSEYLFFVELLGYPTDTRVRRALELLEKKTVRLDILGAYGC